jgi:hypothetical protein
MIHFFETAQPVRVVYPEVGHAEQPRTDVSYTRCAVRMTLRRHLGGWRLPALGELEDFLKVRGDLLSEGDCYPDYSIRDARGGEILWSEARSQNIATSQHYLLAVRQCRHSEVRQ